MAEKYGNLPLGQVYKLLISIIGRDVALIIAEEYGIPIIGKDLDRMFEEKDISLDRIGDGIIEISRKFYGMLMEEYGFPCFFHDMIYVRFGGTFRNALKGVENPTDELRGVIPYEMPTSKLAFLLLKWSFGDIFGGPYESGSISEKSILSLLDVDCTFDNIFKKVFEKLGIPKTEFYKKTEKFYKGNPLDDFEQALKRGISECCKNNTNEPWKNEEKNWYKFKAILDFINSEDKIEKELIRLLIGLYLLKNTEAALIEVCGIEQGDIDKVKHNVRLWADENIFRELKNEAIAAKYEPSDLSLLQRDFIDPCFQNQITAIQECGAYLWGNTSIVLDKAKQLIETMENECLNCGIFFASWARARLAVLSRKFDGSNEDEALKNKALEGYHIAFVKGRKFAGAYLKAFLEESIAATVYFNPRGIKDIPKVIDPNGDLKTPITDDKNTDDDIKENEEKDRKISYGAKQYYEYGYALNMFEQESSETYLLHFNAKEHFWKVFPQHLFIYTDVVSEKASKDLLRAKGLYFIEGGKEGLKQYNEALKQKLEKVLDKEVTDKAINKRMEIQHGHNVQYTPLSIAIQRGYLDIAEQYLKKFSKMPDGTVNERIFTTINTHGSTALLEALTQYKKHRLSKRDEQNTERYKKIIMELINRSPVDSLYAETVKSHISVLEEAINTFDIEIVKAIVEKKGFNIQDLKISADELSPLYYTISRRHYLSEAISDGGLQISNNENINWSKANFPGIFKEGKMAYYENIKSDPLFNSKEMERLNSYMLFGKPEIWKQEFKEFNEIVEFLIEKTDDVDKFAKEAPTGECTTALDLAVEFDFDDICRLLIEKGADPARIIFDKNNMPYDSPFIRAAWFKSWKTLEMLLTDTDFKGKIKPIINKCYREPKQTAAHLLFKVDYGPFYNYSINTENSEFIERFIPLFRSAGAKFDIPDSYGTTVRQILRKYNLEDLIYLISIQ